MCPVNIGWRMVGLAGKREGREGGRGKGREGGLYPAEHKAVKEVLEGRPS